MNINTSFPVGLHIYCFNNNSVVEKFLKRKEKKLDYINCKRNEVLFYISQHNTNAVRQRLTERNHRKLFVADLLSVSVGSP